MRESGSNSVLQEDLNYIADAELPYEVLQGKTMFVTGATGLVGSQLIRALACINRVKELDMRILMLVRSEEKAQRIFGELLEREDIGIIKGDILDDPDSFMDADVRIDYIIHAAAVTTSKIMVEKPVDVIEISISGTKNMLELARIKNVKGFVYISSMEMYGKFEGNHGFVSETDQGFIDVLDVRSNYPLSKRMCENLCMGYQKQYGVPVYIARLAQTFGAGILEGENRVFAQFARSAVSGDDIVLHTKGLSEGNYCYTRDMVLAVMTILLNGEKGNAYNVVNEETHTTIAAMAEMVCREISNGKSHVIFDIPEENVYGYAADTKMRLSSKKLQSLGWQPSINLMEAYNRMIDSMKINK